MMKRTNRDFRAVIFDMDGVIVDSMPYHFISWYEALLPLGIRVSCFDIYAREGERWEKSLKEILASRGIKPTRKIMQGIFYLRQRIFKKYFRRFIFKGVKEFLGCLKERGFMLGLVTGTPEKEIRKILAPALLGLFDVVVAGDQVKHGKPHPEPYLRACRALKLAPADCAVIENAPLGVRSAKSAGMFCIALTTSLPGQYLKAADVIAAELEEIPGIISRACRLKKRALAK